MTGHPNPERHTDPRIPDEGGAGQPLARAAGARTQPLQGDLYRPTVCTWRIAG